MHPIDKVALLAELDGAHCELNHGPGTDAADFPAVNYLVLPIGYEESKDVEVAVRELTIPICQTCINGLNSQEWTLLYCFECGSNQWIFRKEAKLDYRHHNIWLKGCPKCTGFSGIYFSNPISSNLCSAR